MQSVKNVPANLLLDCQNQLGEGIQWNVTDQRVYWTDVFGKALWSCDEHGGAVRKLDLEKGLSAFAFRKSGLMLGAFFDGLYNFDPETGDMQLVRPYQQELSDRTRMNDGNLDPRGRFIVGGIDEAGMHPITPVWSVHAGAITPIIEHVGCANSICFSPDGRTMYFTDSRDRKIYAYEYDPVSGAIGTRRIFAVLFQHEGKPDGSCVDAEGGLWNAQFGGGKVQRFLPNGSRDARIDLPVPNATCCTIGGKRLDRMFITTARLAMSPEDLSSSPAAGGLFVCDLNVKGRPHGTFLD